MDIAVKSGYPDSLKDKLLKRRIACQEALQRRSKQDKIQERRKEDEMQNQEQTTKTFDSIQESRKKSGNNSLSGKKDKCHEEGKDTPCLLHFMHPSIGIFDGWEGRGGGRGVRATSDIQDKQVLLRESCYTWVLYPEFWTKFCYHCLRKLSRLVNSFPETKTRDRRDRNDGDVILNSNLDVVMSSTGKGKKDRPKKDVQERQENNRKTIERHSEVKKKGFDDKGNQCDIPSSSMSSRYLEICYPCWTCTKIRFCSLSCRTNAWTQYHARECGFLNLILDMDPEREVSPFLTLRVLLMQGISSFLSAAESKISRQEQSLTCDDVTGIVTFSSSSSHTSREARDKHTQQNDREEIAYQRKGQQERLVKPVEGFEGFDRLVFHPHLSPEVEKDCMRKATFILAFYLEAEVRMEKLKKESSLSPLLPLQQLLLVRNEIDKQIRKCQVNSMHVTVREIEIQEDSYCSSPGKKVDGESLASQNTILGQTTFNKSVLRPENISLVEKRIACATFLTLSFLNHSCDPNAKVVKFEGKEMTLQTIKSVSTGDEIFISYGLFSKYHRVCHRRQELASSYRFICSCDSCSQGIEPTFNCLRCQECQGPILWNDDEEEEEGEKQGRIHGAEKDKKGEDDKRRGNASDATHDNNDDDILGNGIKVRRHEIRVKKEMTSSVDTNDSENEMKKKEGGEDQIKSGKDVEKTEPELSLSSQPSLSALNACLRCRHQITKDDIRRRKSVIWSGSRLLSNGMDKFFLAERVMTVEKKDKRNGNKSDERKFLLSQAVDDLTQGYNLLSSILYQNHMQLSIALDQMSLGCKSLGRFHDALKFGKQCFSIVSSSMDEDVYLFNCLFKLLDCYRFAILFDRTTRKVLSAEEVLSKESNNINNKNNDCNKTPLESEAESMLETFLFMLNNLLPEKSPEKDFYNRQLLPLKQLLGYQMKVFGNGF